MKRLLSYLFIVFGLALMFNVNVQSSHKYGHVDYCVKKKGDYGKWPFYSTTYGKCPKKFKKVTKYEYETFKKKINEKYAPKGVVSKAPKEGFFGYKPSSSYIEPQSKISFRETKKREVEKNKISLKKNINKILNVNDYDFYAFEYPNSLTMSSIYETRTFNKSEAILLLENGECKFGSSLDKLVENYKYETNFDFKCSYRVRDNNIHARINDKVSIFIYPKKKKVRTNSNIDKTISKIRIPSEILSLAKFYNANKLIKQIMGNKNKTQIAKAEPSQTQKVDKKETIPEWYIAIKKSSEKIIYSRGSGKSKEILVSKEKALQAALVKTSKTLLSRINRKEKENSITVSSGDFIQKCISSDGKTISCEDNRDDFNWSSVTSYKIEKTETKKLTNGEYRTFTIISVNPDEVYEDFAKLLNWPKKKVKVAKVEEPKQEEFKPENKDIDNDAPVIEIAQNITVDSQTYTLKGKVKDKSRFQLTIDDRPIKVAKNGEFEFEGFAIDSKEQLKIVAIDRWKNKSEKVINVEVKLKQVADLRSYEKPNPSKIKVKKDNNKIGIVIGIEKYQNLNNIDAPYANRDAKAFKAYANIALGIPSNNLKVLIDEDATRGELLKSLKIWLPQITRGQKKDIYIFFAGHGLASDNGEDLHILPHNGDPILLEDTALSRIEMFDLINKVNPKSVTMFFDTCYSGQTRSEQMLIAGLRPVRIVADEQDTPNNFTIFTASDYDQTSGSINEAEHGIFSYYLMKGLEGKADENSDKKITNGELISYLKNNVTQEAFSQNRSQEPMLSGDPDKVLISYR